MAQGNKITLYALDCGTVNWRLYRMEYHYDGERAQHVTSPLSSPLSNFTDRKLPAVITLSKDGTDIEFIGERALSLLEDNQTRNRIREFFKPSIGSHLLENPSPHQQRYSHFEALLFTRLLLKTLIGQIQEEKYNSEPFDDRIHFSIAYPDRWHSEYEGKAFDDFYHVILECFPAEICDQVHFVPESEGVILGLRDQGLLDQFHSREVNLILDVGASNTTIYARKFNSETGILDNINRYEEPFGGGLYDALLAKYLSDQLQISSKELASDTSAFMALRIWGQLLKESLSRKFMGREEASDNLIEQQAITLVTLNEQVFRKNISISLEEFSQLNHPLDQAFQEVVTRALDDMEIEEDAVGRVILLGGGVRQPGILEGIRSRFGKDMVIFPDHPEEIIVRGIGLAFTDSVPKSEQGKTKKTKAQKKADWRLIDKDGHVMEINNETTIAGRSKGAELTLESAKCSRTHALIRLEGNALTLIDLRSKNGTFINNSQIAPSNPQQLKGGDKIRFGDQTFTVD
ncbi:MAG: FHA domain-containing protein [Anaerolineales bacterium]|nr:FHA domain-containing protein [Anaerolineales bacterium]